MKPCVFPVRRLPESRLPRLAAFALLGFLLLGLRLSGRSSDATPVDVTGVYQLVSIDGHDLPHTLKHGKQVRTVQSGSFTITTNGQCLSHMIMTRNSETNLVVCDTRATYTIQGSKLNMIWRSGGHTQGEVAGKTFIMGNEGMKLVYRK